jgi:hypothetical protein
MLPLIASCAQIANISNRQCVPIRTPSTVVTLRTTYLYRFEHEGGLQLWDALYQSFKGGSKIETVEAPLTELPPGTKLKINNVARESSFDGVGNPSIKVYGEVDLDGRTQVFRYLWGINNTINDAPWESADTNPGNVGRQIGC